MKEALMERTKKIAKEVDWKQMDSVSRGLKDIAKGKLKRVL